MDSKWIHARFYSVRKENRRFPFFDANNKIGHREHKWNVANEFPKNPKKQLNHFSPKTHE